jgi:hypothetical protein
MKRIRSFKDFEKVSKEGINDWLSKLKTFSRREAEETKVASKIFRKLIRKNLGIDDAKPTAEEIKFLKDHSKDLMKILGFVATTPTPIPYTMISLILKKAGLVNLFPEAKDLDVPEQYKKSRDKEE